MQRRDSNKAVFVGTVTSIGLSSVIWLATSGLFSNNPYGAWLFFILPLIAGVVSGLVVSWDNPKRPALGYQIAVWSYLVVTLISLVARWEGVLCLIMGAPVVVLSHAFSFVLTTKAIQALRKGGRETMVSAALLLLIPAYQSAAQIPLTAERVESTVIEIDAPAERIWPLLFNLPSVPSPNHPLLAAGVAHPVAVRSAATTVGARRECVLSTGIMPETITVVEQNRLLRFAVGETPPPVREVNPFGEVHAAHEHGYFTVHDGEFQLESLPNGRTRVTGTSRYAYRLYPELYWGLWCDHLVDQIHRSVIEEIKRQAER